MNMYSSTCSSHSIVKQEPKIPTASFSQKPSTVIAHMYPGSLPCGAKILKHWTANGVPMIPDDDWPNTQF